MKKILNRYKFSIGHLILSFFLVGILSIAFFVLMFPFMQRAEGLPFDEAAKVGGANLWRIVFFYGFFTSIFVFIAFWRKIFRLTAVILILFWLAGTSLVVLINSNPTAPSGLDTNQLSAEIPTFTGQEIFDAVNNYRKNKGISELELDQIVCSNIAQRYLDNKSGLEEGIAHKGFEEWHKKYTQPYGYFVAENFAWGKTPQEVIEVWDGSPSHRLSVLDSKAESGCAYAFEGYAVLILGYKQINTTQSQNKIPSRTGEIIPYREWCTGKDISIYENELITKPSSDGNVYSMTQGDWDCYEDYLKNKR